MANINIPVSEELVRDAEALLRRRGDSLENYAGRVLNQALMRECLAIIREDNKHLSAKDAQRIADEAVARYRADHP